VLVKKYLTTNSNKASEITFLRLTVAAMLVAIVIEGLIIQKTLGMEKTVVLPPEVNKSFWVTSNSVSKDYLEQMAYWYAGLVLNASPYTGEYQKQMFLRYATPTDTGRLSKEMDNRIDYLKQNNASTQFAALTISADENAMKVSISGDLSTFIGDKRVSNKIIFYAISFKYLNSRLYVSEFKETNDKDIYGTSTPAAK